MINLAAELSGVPIAAILRSRDASRFVDASMRIAKSGIRCLEFTMTTSGALDALVDVRSVIGNDVLFGIGSLREPAQVHAAIDAGADFCVNQYFDAELVDAAHSRGVPFVPGALTPSEIMHAWRYGVQAVKISPVGPVGGVSYVSETSIPMPEVALMPTGGVLIEDAAAYLAAGARLVGLSRHLLEDSLLPDGDLDALSERADRLVALVTAHRQ